MLDANQFQSLDQARAVTEEWLAIYNEQRTHSAIGQLPPLAFKRRWQSQEIPVISGLG
ncbi:integrase core domain-containing protein [Denitratimonas sp. CY0512]|uniref:integrase core domain-containing protein n=1 Tax=Denitratimonas sp. CY0512 TaxID=3131940 RepID=UPI0030B112AD